MKMKKFTFPKLSIEQLKTWIVLADQKTLIQNAIAAGSFLIFIFLFFLPILMHNKKLLSEVNALRNKINQASFKITRIPEMTRQKELFGARTKRIREQFFEVKETDKLIEIMSTLAAQTGLTISASRPASRTLELPPAFALMYLPVSYELVVEGSYHNLGTFINSLERYSKNFAVHDLQITTGEKNPNTQQCTMVLTAFMKRQNMFQQLKTL